jgi:hypothetical protein
MSDWEICDIEKTTLRNEQKGFFRIKPCIFRWKARIMTSSGSETVSESRQFKGWTATSTDEEIEKSQRNEAKAHRELIDKLKSKGWETYGTGNDGKTVSMRRRVDSAGDHQANDAATLLQQLANLRDQGILTEQEYQTKTAEVLKRI